MLLLPTLFWTSNVNLYFLDILYISYCCFVFVFFYIYIFMFEINKPIKTNQELFISKKNI